MKRIVYNFDKSIYYRLNKSNVYAYSFFATIILKKKEKFKIDLNSIISNISDTIDSMSDEVNELRNINHKNYYSIDFKFLKGVSDRYKDKAKEIIKMYKEIDSLSLLKDNLVSARENKKIIDRIINNITDLKEKMTSDLMMIIDYVDRDEKLLDLTFLNDDNIEANKLKRFYNALILHKSVINMDNVNLEMERQKHRLASIRTLIPLVNTYMNSRSKYVNNKYNKDDIINLKNRLSIILSDYIFLLTHQEFSGLKMVYEGILKNDYSYIDEFIYTYKIIVDKVWKYSLTDIDTFSFDFNYIIQNNNRYYLMNRNNMDDYYDIGYICEYNNNIFDCFNITRDDLFKFKLPIEIKDRFELNVKNMSEVNKIAMYNKGNEVVSDSNYLVVEVK